MENKRDADTIRLRGDVRITIEDEETGEVEIQEYRNLVVTNGKEVVAKLLGGDASYADLEEVNTIAWGTGAAAPAAGNTDLAAQQFTKTAAVTYPAANQVTFDATMLGAEGGSFTYAEIGLKTKTTGILFSRALISPFVKSTAKKHRVVWTISIQ